MTDIKIQLTELYEIIKLMILKAIHILHMQFLDLINEKLIGEAEFLLHDNQELLDEQKLALRM
jgi:hypothetical protein